MHRFNIIIIITKCIFVIVGATASQCTFQGTNYIVKDYGSLITKYEEMIFFSEVNNWCIKSKLRVIDPLQHL